ncbi:Uncharacterized protein OBRU01_03945 [Operophtera brumata]|uniref:CCHC-type domain-containing protein n=1 Tax=Operophtera brumata TaxID=104452 RepID=A0A0L7LG40_OPEBR|nr:Uncharacterized protein OBRU01_03945 [Operophtera brumata]
MGKNKGHRRRRSKSRSVATPRNQGAGSIEREGRSRSQSRGRTRSRSPHKRRRRDSLRRRSRSRGTPRDSEARSRSQSRGRTPSHSPHTRHASLRRSRSKGRPRDSRARQVSDRSHSRSQTRSRSPHAYRARRHRSRSRERNSRPSRSTSKRPKPSDHVRHGNSNDRRESPPASLRSRLRCEPSNSKENDVQSLFFKKFIDFMSNIRPTSDTDKFPIINIIPEFDPLNKEQTVDVWIKKVDECAQIYTWSDKQIVHYAMPKLSGIAKTWYQGLPSLLHSWAEWKVKLRESFPTCENYAELLSEMLSKRVRFGEPLDLYFYSKMNLLNRCDIAGKRAVDCLLAGIDDRNVRVGGQSAEFAEPEQVLNFLKSVKVGQVRSVGDIAKNRDKRDNHWNNSKILDKSSTSSQNSSTNKMTCYNCKEKGHPFFRCPKPRLHCENCNLLGHATADCTKSKHGAVTEEKSKNVLKIDGDYNTSLKYKIPIKVDSKLTNCIVDLGSEGTLIRISEAERLQLKWQEVNGPRLKGLGNVTYLPIGMLRTKVEVQGITEHNVPILVVDDQAIPCPLLLGHTFTERPYIKIVKTDTDVIFQKTKQHVTVKCPLVCEHAVTIGINEIKPVSVKCNNEYTGTIYVHGNIRHALKREHYLLPGEYMLKEGTDTISTTQTSLPEIRSEASDLIREQQLKDKEAFDKHRKKAVEFKEGDLVRVIRATAGIEGQSKKLEPKCRGPYRIKKVLPNDRYIVEDTPITRKGKRYEAIVAVDKIFPWLSITQSVSSSDNESSNDDESLKSDSL